jgi:hypothetical protein
LKQRRLAADLDLATDSETPDDLALHEISTDGLQEQFESADFMLSNEPLQMQLEEWDTSAATFNHLDPLNLTGTKMLDTVLALSHLYDINNLGGSNASYTPLDDLGLATEPLPLETFHNSPSNFFSTDSTWSDAQDLADSHPTAQQQTNSPSTTFLFTNHIRLRDLTSWPPLWQLQRRSM